MPNGVAFTFRRSVGPKWAPRAEMILSFRRKRYSRFGVTVC